MVREAAVIKLTDHERGVLENWVRDPATEQRMAQRARIVLEAAAGSATKDIAAQLHVRAATVSHLAHPLRPQPCGGPGRYSPAGQLHLPYAV